MSLRTASASVAALCVALLAGPAHPLRAGAQSPPPGQTRGPSDAAVLEPGASIERELMPGQEHRYELALMAGEYASVVIEQRGIDIRIQTRLPDGSSIAEFQEEVRPQGREQVEVVADAGGVYLLAVIAGPAVESGSYGIRVGSRRAATAADRSLQEARTMRTTAARLQASAKPGEARPLLERALSIAETVRGRDEPLVGTLLFELAGTAMAQRDDARAEGLYQRSLAILEKAWGGEHPYPALVRARLALLIRRAGQGPKAEPLLRQACEVIERALGAGHPWVATCLMNQAIFRNEAGDRDRAVALNLRVLAIYEALGETSTANYAGTLNNLGDLYRQTGQYARAEELFLRSLALAERLEGKESHHLSILYQSLGIVARERKDYARASQYYRHALAIRERLLGSDHPDVAEILNNLAVVQRLTGDTPGSIETHMRALAIWSRARGPHSTGALTSTGNIARMYAADGNVVKAIEFQRRADALIDRQLRLSLAVGSEREKLAFMSMVNERTERTLSLSLREASGDPDASRLATLVLLQRKGRVPDAMSDTLAAAQERVTDPADRSLLDQLRATTAQLSRLTLSPPGAASPADRQTPIEALEAKRERLEADLSERSAELGAQLRPATLDALQAAIPDDAALIEFAVFRPFDPGAERNDEAYGSPHYAAFVVRRQGAPRGVDLGPAAEIDAVVEAFRQALRDPRGKHLAATARTTDTRVMQPLRALCGDAARLLISPDGNLNLVPFEALIDEHGRYQIERYAMSYLTSGRDLLRVPAPAGSSAAVIVVADPHFGEPEPPDSPATRTASPQLLRQTGTSSADLSAMYFAPLAGTRAEARAIAALFADATLLTGRGATKAAVERVAAPRILHIASHGFILQQPIANPLLRSGLALAGANVTGGQREAGILTALEAAHLNLRGTRLVTLSACDTGVGEVRNGEGVYGLRRAFVLAGTETLVMSLWPVSDYLSREMMQAYYTGLRAGRGRGDALRQAKLAMLARSGREHPFYWASFIQSGEWANLDGAR